jgi:hypothetical protein
MKTLFLLLLLFLSFSPVCYGREIFEGGYSGNYVKDSYRPDTAIDAFSGEEKTIERQGTGEIYSALPMQDNDYDNDGLPNRVDNYDGVSDKTDDPFSQYAKPHPVYIAPIGEIIKKQAAKSGESNDSKEEE